LKHIRKLKRNPLIKKITPYFRIIIGIVAFLTVIILAANSLKDSSLSTTAFAFSSSVESSMTDGDVLIYKSVQGVSYELEKPSKKDFKKADERYQEKLQGIEEEQQKLEEQKIQQYEQRVSILRAYLYNQASPMAPYAHILLKSCDPYGLHYCKYFISISGVETGFGRVDFGTKNAWGWGGIKFTSWEESIVYVSNAIAQHYYLKGYNTFEKLAYESNYGAHNADKWVHDLYLYYNQIPNF